MTPLLFRTAHALNAVFQPLLDLLFPCFCLSCGLWVEGHAPLCGACELDLKESDHFFTKDNPLQVRMGIPNGIQAIGTLYLFEKGTVIQQLLHQLKYNGRKETGVFLGEKMAQRIKETSWLNGEAVVVPVPLHPKKMRKRGFNQSVLIAGALAEDLGWEMRNDVLVRIKHTEAQAQIKDQQAREANVAQAFQVKEGLENKEKPIVLVDDVLTTGATMLSAAQELLSAGFSNVYLASAAWAKS